MTRIGCMAFAVLQFCIAASLAVPPPVSAAGPIATPLFIVSGDDPARPFVAPMDVFYDRQFDEVYVADTGSHRIVVFDRDGYPLHSIPRYVTRGGRRIPGEPQGVAVDSRGRIYVVDALCSHLTVIDAQGILLGRILPAAILPGAQAVRVVKVHVDETDHIYLGVSGQYAGVIVLDPQWEFVAAYPPVGSPAPVRSVTGVSVDAAGDLYLTDPAGIPAVRVFTRDGRERLSFGEHDVGVMDFSRPSGLTVDRQGVIWVVDMIRQVVKAFDPAGRYLAYVGGRGVGPGSLDYPSAVATDGRDRLYVLNRGRGGLTCFEVRSDAVPSLVASVGGAPGTIE